MTKKACYTCKKPKLLSDFHKRPDTIDGRAGQCKSCQSEKQKNWKAELRERKKMFV